MLPPPNKIVGFMTAVSEEENTLALKMTASLLVGQQPHRTHTKWLMSMRNSLFGCATSEHPWALVPPKEVRIAVAVTPA
jgi:hypothetical protein